MVTTCLPVTFPKGIRQLVTVLYSNLWLVISPIKTVQAPQSPSLQPILVPMSLRWYRIKSSKVGPGCTSAAISLSFNINLSKGNCYRLKVMKKRLKKRIDSENKTEKYIPFNKYFTCLQTSTISSYQLYKKV